MPNETKNSILEETFKEIATIKEALSENASALLNGDLKTELQNVVAQAINEAKFGGDDNSEKENSETEDGNAETKDTKVPSDDTGEVSGEPTKDVADDLPPADANPMGDDAPPTDELPPMGGEEGGEMPPTDADDIVDLTGASDEEVLQVFKKMGPEDEIEVVQTSDGNYELKLGGEEYIIKTGGGAPEPEGTEGIEGLGGAEIGDGDGDADDMKKPADGLMEGDYKQELARVKEMGKDKGNVDDSRRSDVKTPKTEAIAKVGESSTINDNQDENSDDRKDVKEPAEKPVAEIGKGGETIDKHVTANMEHGKSDKRTDVSKPAEVGVAKVKSVAGNMSMEGDNKPNFDRGTKSTPVDADPKVKEKTTVGIAESAEQLKKKLDENHDKLVFTRQKYAEVVADNANLRDQITALNESVTAFKNGEEGYKKAISTLKEEINEIALFTSNLTYAVKLMTEHATTKEEKNQILARFETAKTLAESRVIYESIAATFGTPKKTAVTIEEQLNKTAASGASSINESTAYQTPEIARMKELMKKMK